MTPWTIDRLRRARESEDKVEFKEARRGMWYDGKTHSVLAYVVAFANEGGGSLVLGMTDRYPHEVVGTEFALDSMGECEARIFHDTGLRPSIYELYEDDGDSTKRVVVIDVPKRPAGKIFTYEGKPLMRVGEHLLPMDDLTRKRIEYEIEPDFSRAICEGATIRDLDPQAIAALKEKYARANHNREFLYLRDEQILSDLELVVDKRVTYAAIILLGKASAIKQFLPNATIRMEYRDHESDIEFFRRNMYEDGFFLSLDRVWDDIARNNRFIPVQEGPYIFTIPSYNESVIREAICNAVAHRDYRRNSEIIIKIYPEAFVVINAGGFPAGISLSNIITAPSTPRNRLLSDVLAKTGIVERSGQGVDKIFRTTLSEGKSSPDYSNSSELDVELKISAVIKDKAFALFISSTQDLLPEHEKLSVMDILHLNMILEERGDDVPRASLRSLMKKKLVESVGRTRATKYFLSKVYYEFAGKREELVKRQIQSDAQTTFRLLLPYLQLSPNAKMRELVSLLGGQMSRKQIRSHIQELCECGKLKSTGQGSATSYSLSDSFIQEQAMLHKAMQVGIEEMRKRGEWI